MTRISDLLRAHDGRARLRTLVPGLTLAEPSQGVGPARSSGVIVAAEAASRARLGRDGYLELAEAAAPAPCARLVTGIGQLLAAGLPAAAVYLFDEPWRLGEGLCARMSALVGEPYVLLNDVWAWQIAAGSRGWAPHRGSTEQLDRRAPELLNVWVALSDAPEERSCMHVVPLDADPAYPAELDHIEVPPGASRALPVTAGTALAWNANVLHWGGACAVTATAPRVSCSFSLARGAFARRFPLAGAATRSFEERLDALALQVETYGEGQPDVHDEVREWARATCALRRHVERLGPPVPRT